MTYHVRDRSLNSRPQQWSRHRCNHIYPFWDCQAWGTFLWLLQFLLCSVRPKSDVGWTWVCPKLLSRLLSSLSRLKWKTSLGRFCRRWILCCLYKVVALGTCPRWWWKACWRASRSNPNPRFYLLCRVSLPCGCSSHWDFRLQYGFSNPCIRKVYVRFFVCFWMFLPYNKQMCW